MPPIASRYRRRSLSRVLTLVLLLLTSPAWSGGGPETTLLVVNAGSPVSLAVANEYIRLRDLPELQVLWLRDIPVGETIDIDSFRRHILDPIQDHFMKTGLGNEIDIILYSAGFPYRVDFSRDLERASMKYHDRIGNIASLTGLTYFLHRVMAMDMGYLHPRANQYYQLPPSAIPGAVTVLQNGRAFRSRHAWKSGIPQVTGSDFDRYYLSVMLGYSGMRGNSLPEILDYLDRAASADGKQPNGTVYLMKNENIRSRVRQPLFPKLVEAMRKRGRAAEIIEGRIPRDRADVIGLVAGTRKFNWSASGSEMLPGAIAECFTSYGGHFDHGMQTKLSEFLRNGAAGSSGTVAEPYSFVEKFPVPQLHQYYADGVSLAEAFYQSISSPYQLIIVGDPLARPFARFANIELAGVDPDHVLRGRVEIVPEVSVTSGKVVERVELWVNGQLMGHGNAGSAIGLDTMRLADGYHEMRFVAVEKGQIETRSFLKKIIHVDNHGLKNALSLDQASLPYGESISVYGKAEGARKVILYQGRRALAEVDVAAGSWSARLESSVLGQGYAVLYAEAHYPDGRISRSRPITLRVDQPASFLGPATDTPAREGIRAVLEMNDGRQEISTLPGLTGNRSPREWQKLSPSSITLTGAFETRAEGLYELDVSMTGRSGVYVNGMKIAGDAGPGEDERVSVPLPLARGWHRFEVKYHSGSGKRLPRIGLMGPEPAFLLNDQRVRH